MFNLFKQFITFFLSIIIFNSVFAETLINYQNKKMINIGTSAGFVPFEMLSSTGKWVGFEVDLITEFAKEINVKANIIDTKWDGIIPALHAKKFDLIMGGMTITEDRQKNVLFSEPYYNAGIMVLLPVKNKSTVMDVKILNDVKYQICVKIGTTAETWVKENLPKAQMKSMNEREDCANTIKLGKMDAFVFDKPYIQLFANLNKNYVFILGDAMTTEHYAIAGRHADKELIDALNKFLVKWKHNKGYDESLKANFIDLIWSKDFPHLIKQNK